MDELIWIDKYLATLPPVNPVAGIDFGGLGDLRPFFLFDDSFSVGACTVVYTLYLHPFTLDIADEESSPEAVLYEGNLLSWGNFRVGVEVQRETFAFLSSRHVRILLEELPRAVDLDMGTTLEGLPFISDAYFDRLARLWSLAEEGVAHDIPIVDEDLTIE